MTIKDRLEAVYPDHQLISYARVSNSIISECPDCGEDSLETKHEYYPENDSWVECMSCGSRFDFRVETNMWIKKRQRSSS